MSRVVRTGVVEVHPERVLRKHLAAHRQLAEPEPGDDDGDGHDDDEPERHGAHDGVPEGLADLLVVVCEEHDLSTSCRIS